MMLLTYVYLFDQDSRRQLAPPSPGSTFSSWQPCWACRQLDRFKHLSIRRQYGFMDSEHQILGSYFTGNQANKNIGATTQQSAEARLMATGIFVPGTSYH